ncbi:MAG: phospholipase D-like domain-containing protein [Gammaproteobacteria bacterium]|nr:cardiolipin synthase [Gammaproteobacteria bacterium]
MQWLNIALAVLVTAAGLAAAVHALLYKRRPQAALGWIAVCLMLPILGALLYYLFGINRVQARARVLRGGTSAKTPVPADNKAGWTHGNDVTALHCGEEAYPAMLEAIRGAEKYVYLSTYIFGTGGVGGEFIDALADAARRGVDVRVLIDGVGELYTWPLAGRALRRRGVRVATFLPPRLVPPTVSINLRNHRKILVVDGEIGFTGGMNIADRHLVADATRRQRVVDVHFRLVGPIVARLEEIFAADWLFTTREKLPIHEPARRIAGAASCRVIADGPDEPRDILLGLLLRSIASAQRRVAIMTPYFLPSPELIGVFHAAALRGIEVDVVLPAKNNLPYVHWASRHMLWQLLVADVRIHYQPAPFVHTKLLLVDDATAVIGSWNIDPRSLRLNFELAVEIHDRVLVAHLGEHFDAALRRSTTVTLADVDGRSLPERLRDGAAWLLSPYL